MSVRWTVHGERTPVRGFTLFELTIVLFIVSLLLGGLLLPLSTQFDAARIREAREQLAELREALLGFAVINDRLPCPAIPASNGLELPVQVVAGVRACSDGIVAVQHGFVPGRTLGIAGAYNDDQLLLDPWGNPLRYSITARDCSGGDNGDGDCADAGEANGAWDYAVAGDMRVTTLSNLAVPFNNDLLVCSDTDPGDPANGCVAQNILADNAVAVFYSLGPDGGSYLGEVPVPPAELENAGEDAVAPTMRGEGPSGADYPVAADRVFIAREIRAAAGNEFDDLVDWIAPVVLINRMVAAQRLP